MSTASSGWKWRRWDRALTMLAPEFGAGFTETPIAITIGISFIERMSLSAMSYGSASRSIDFSGSTTPNIFTACYGFQVVRAHTSAMRTKISAITGPVIRVTNMVILQTLWWLANKKMMGEHRRRSTEREGTVAIRIFPAKPHPAAICTTRIDITPEALGRRPDNPLRIPSLEWIAMSLPALEMKATESMLKMKSPAIFYRTVSFYFHTLNIRHAGA